MIMFTKSIKNLTRNLILALVAMISICFVNFSKYDLVVNNGVLKSFFNYIFNQPLTLIFISIFALAFFMGKRKAKVLFYVDKHYIFLFSLLFSLVFYTCKSYNLLNNWSLWNKSIYNFIFSIIIVIGLMILTYFIITHIFLEVTHYFIKQDNELELDFQYYFNLSFKWFLVIGIVYLLIFLPGNLSYDGAWQLTYYYGLRAVSNHHPLVSTLFQGIIFDFGTRFGGYNFGLFGFLFIQIIFQAYVLASCIKVIVNMTKIKAYILFAIVYYVVTPWVYSYGITLVKDTFYYNIFLLFMITISKLCIFIDSPLKHGKILLIVSSVLLCLYRNDGIFIVVPTLICLAIYQKLRQLDFKVTIFTIAISLMVVISLTCYIYPVFNIKQEPIEAFSVPLQQTARLVWSGKEITDEDKDKLKICWGGKNLKKIYNPVFADPVKFSFNVNKLEVWEGVYLKYMFIYPQVYVQAFFNHVYGYFYPFYFSTETGIYSISKDKLLYSDIINCNRISPLRGMQFLLSKLPLLYSHFPVLSLLYNCSFFVWSIVFLFGLAIYQKKYNLLIITIPLLLNIGVCLFSPVSGDLRYLLPVAISFPLYMSCYIFSLKKSIYVGE
jgi:hypothetical protein